MRKIYFIALLFAASVACCAPVNFGLWKKPAGVGSAPTFVGELGRGANVNSTTTQTISVPTSISAGTDLVLPVQVYLHTAATISSATDSKGNTWSIVAQRANGSDGYDGLLRCRVANALTTSDTITITMTAAETVTFGWALFSILGAAASGQPDTFASVNGTGTSISAASSTAGSALCIGFIHERWTHAYSGGTWTQIGATHAWGDYENSTYFYKVVSAGSQDPGGSIASSATWNVLWVALK